MIPDGRGRTETTKQTYPPPHDNRSLFYVPSSDF